MAAANFFSYARRTLVVSSRYHDISEDIGRKGRGDIVGGVLIKMSISWMIPRKILIKRHVDVLDFSSFLSSFLFSFFLVTLVEGEEGTKRREAMSRGRKVARSFE